MTFWYPFLQGYCAVLKGPGGLSPISGGYGEGETPLPFPNRAVKPLRADGTWPARARESRSPPVSSAQRTAFGWSVCRCPGVSARLRVAGAHRRDVVVRRRCGGAGAGGCSGSGGDVELGVGLGALGDCAGCLLKPDTARTRPHRAWSARRLMARSCRRARSPWWAGCARRPS